MFTNGPLRVSTSLNSGPNRLTVLTHGNPNLHAVGGQLRKVVPLGRRNVKRRRETERWMRKINLIETMICNDI